MFFCGNPDRDRTYTSIEKVTGTCHNGELKENVNETFKGYQEHVRMKRIMQSSFEKDKADNMAYVSFRYIMLCLNAE